ncbi:MAG: IS1-like element transposase [Symbiopectobacterium sp.]
MTDQIIDLAMNNAGIRDTARAYILVSMPSCVL